MELRHLRYFVAVADAGNLTVAAQRMLHTSQPSLSRQIRDLENEVGAQLLTRRARGVALTPAGRAFLDHARVVPLQVDRGRTTRCWGDQHLPFDDAAFDTVFLQHVAMNVEDRVGACIVRCAES